MKLYFQCPRTDKTFSSEDYSLADNQGVVDNGRGEKILQAVVVVHLPCPHCLGIHSYRVEDLICPLTHGQD